MDLPIALAGNFMELRSNHFHAGLDMKTNGRTGQPVMAVADGWVSRIKVRAWGYGHAVYIDHPSGYTTVYGHLDHLNGDLATTLLDLQYANKSWSVDQYYKRGELPVSKGQVIAFSGNTGGSTAPHLHFEVRRTADQHALDPELFGMNAPDRVPPIFTGLRTYALGPTSGTSPYSAGNVGFVVAQLNDSTYGLRPGISVEAFGTVGLAVNVTDRYSNSHNTCGIRSLLVNVDGTNVISIHLDESNFGLQRYANAYMDYGLFKDHYMHYNRCYKLPNNKLDIYGDEPAQGRINVVPGKDHAVQVIAKDASGNRSTLTFMLHGATAEEAAAWPADVPEGQLCHYDRSNTIQLEGMRFSLPPNALYEDKYVTSAVSGTPAHALAPLYHLQDELTPLQRSGDLRIQVADSFPPSMASKLLVVRMANGRPVAEGGSYANGEVKASVRNFGAYTVMMDTVPPKLSLIGFSADMKGRKNFKVKVRDNLSGIDQWVGRIDDRWILMNYDPKNALLEHIFDKHTDVPGPHTFSLEVIDERGNRSTLTRKFTR